MSDDLEWADDDQPVFISMFPVAGKYHVDLCEDTDCERTDHVEVSKPWGAP